MSWTVEQPVHLSGPPTSAEAACDRIMTALMADKRWWAGGSAGVRATPSKGDVVVSLTGVTATAERGVPDEAVSESLRALITEHAELPAVFGPTTWKREVS